jgi:hypothetical protein
MRYGPQIIEQILEELRKVPNIRHVCNKVGIDHSTFYRWMDDHFKFHQMVELALYLGRQKINDAAESVIITGIQNNDFKSAKYFLSHNSERYIGVERIRYFQYLERNLLDFLHKSEDSDQLEEAFFEHFQMLEDALGKDEARQQIVYLASAYCRGDSDKVANLRSKYSLWQQEREKRKKKEKLEDDESAIH